MDEVMAQAGAAGATVAKAAHATCSARSSRFFLDLSGRRWEVGWDWRVTANEGDLRLLRWSLGTPALARSGLSRLRFLISSPHRTRSARTPVPTLPGLVPGGHRGCLPHLARAAPSLLPI